MLASKMKNMTENGFEYVDLGLPSGTMWATCNVGADKPEDEGLLFQFGRVTGYRYSDNNNQFKTYNQNKQDTGCEFIPKTTSGKIYKENEILDLTDDAAHVNMGGKWKMPTRDELEELLNNTTHDVSIVNRIKGMMFTSNTNGNQLFIPFIQCIWYDGHWDNVDKFYVDMWSSQVHTSIVDGSYLLYCGFCSNTSITISYRSDALSVRGVFRK